MCSKLKSAALAGKGIVMKRILEMLYDGDIFPPAKQEKTTERLCEKRRKAETNYERFMEKLGEKEKQSFMEVMDSDMDVIAEEIRTAYINGLRMGIRLMSEVFSEE